MLFAHDRISLDRGAQLAYTIGRRRSTLRGPTQGYMIPQPMAEGIRFTAAMRLYAREGGLPRGIADQINRPTPNSVAMAKDFSIHWSPSLSVVHGTVSLLSGSSALWSGPVDAEWGQLKNPQLEQAVKKIQNTETLTPLVITLELEDGSRQESSFNLLSKADETKINLKLAEVDRLVSGITLGLLRAEVFHDSGLLNNEADELEATTRIAPYSVDLVKATLVAELAVGNVRRARELALKLPLPDRPREQF
jgi:hypothetical protein